MDSDLQSSEPRSARATSLLPVFLLALAVRLGLLFYLHPMAPRGEEDFVVRLARSVAGGGAQSLYQPFWSFLLSLPIAIFHHSYAARVLCAVLGAGSVALVHRIAEQTVDSRAARVAAVLYAFYPEQALLSHSLYADIPLEFFTLSGVAVLFDAWPHRPPLRHAALAFLLIGIGALFNPFAGIAWAAVLATFWTRAEGRLRFGWVSGLFLVPAVLFALWSWHVSGDPAALLRKPLVLPSGSAEKSIDALKGDESGAHLLRRRVAEFFPAASPAAVLSNFVNLWTPNSYAAERFRVQYYGNGDSDGAGYVIAAAHVLLITLGVIGLVAAPWGQFKTYATASLLLLSAMSITWLLVSRYRVFELHIFVLYAAFALTRHRYVRGVVFSGKRLLAAALLLLVFGAVCVSRWSTIGSWP